MTATTAGTTEPPGPSAPSRHPRPGLSVRVRILATLLSVVFVALTGAGMIVYVIERDRVENEVAANVEQELAELAALQRDGVDPDTQQPFTSASQVISTFLDRNVAGSHEVLVGWWDGQARQSTPAPPGLDLDLRTALRQGGDLYQVLSPLAEAGRSARIDLPGLGEVSVTVQPVLKGGQQASLLMLTFMDLARAGLRDTMQTYTLVSAGALVVIAVGATWQSGRLLSPLRDLRRATEQITASDLSERLPERGNDDLTRLTRTFNGMLDRLEASFSTQRQFLDDAGHELKTPLTVLRGHLELLDPDDPSDVAETRALLLDETDRMGRLVEDLILLAKVRRPDFVRAEPVDVGDLTRTVLAKAQGMASRDWLLDATADVQAVLDEQRITQALLQLVDNAVKHTDPRCTVALGSTVRDDSVHLWVRDTGDGVPVEQRERIFSRFHRARVPVGDEGFGLGLSVVRAIAEASGGTVRVEDPPPPHPPGSRFVLSIPLIQPPTAHPREDPWPRS